MGRYKHQRAFTIPAARRLAINTILERHGYGPDNFSVPLKQGNSPNVTHYGCDIVLDDVMLSIIRGAGQISANFKEHNKPFKQMLQDEGMTADE